MSITFSGSDKPPTPQPMTRQVLPSGALAYRSARAPMALTAAAVARTSSPSSRPVTRVSPTQSAPSINARWEIDLSPGTRTAPDKAPEGPARSGVLVVFTSLTETGSPLEKEGWRAALCRRRSLAYRAARRQSPTECEISGILLLTGRGVHGIGHGKKRIRNGIPLGGIRHNSRQREAARGETRMGPQGHLRQLQQ